MQRYQSNVGMHVHTDKEASNMQNICTTSSTDIMANDCIFFLCTRVDILLK